MKLVGALSALALKDNNPPTYLPADKFSSLPETESPPDGEQAILERYIEALKSGRDAKKERRWLVGHLEGVWAREQGRHTRTAFYPGLGAAELRMVTKVRWKAQDKSRVEDFVRKSGRGDLIRNAQVNLKKMADWVNKLGSDCPDFIEVEIEGLIVLLPPKETP